MAGVLARRDGPPYRPRSFESAAPASGERSEHGEIPPVLRKVGALRRLDAHGKAGEAPVAQQPAEGLQQRAERARRGANPRVLARTAVRAGMRDQVRDAEALAALELGDQLAHRARAQRLDRRRRVGEVGVMCEQRPDAGRRARRREGAYLVLGEWAQRPLPRRAREELDRLAADRAPALERAMEPARGRLLRAEERAGAGRGRACIAAGQAAPWVQAPLRKLK